MNRSRIGPKNYEEAKEAATRRAARRLARQEGKPRSYIGPRSLAEAKARQIARDANRAARGQQRPKGKGLERGKALRAKPDRKLIAWSKAVRARDGNQCQWPGITVAMPSGFKITVRLALTPCATGDTRIDPHHKAKRSQRRDLKYIVSNGACLCRTHHDWTDANHDAAVAIGLLDTTSRELARKEAA